MPGKSPEKLCVSYISATSRHGGQSGSVSVDHIAP